MIKVDKNEVEIEVSGDEKNEESVLLAELSVALIEVAKYLKRDREEVLNALNSTIIFSIGIDNIIDNLKECIGGKNG